jgi:maltose-binding protein MalE
MRFLLLVLLMYSGLIYARQELTLWHDKFEAAPLYEQLSKNFENATGVKLNPQYMPTPDLKLATLKSSHSGSAPDILVAPSDFIGNRNALRLSVVPEPLGGNSLPLAAASVTDDGKQFGIPLLFGNHLVLYYNKQLVSEPATQWDQLIAQKALFESKGASLISWKTDEMYWVIPFLTAFGGKPVVGNMVYFDNAHIQKGLEFYREQVTSAGLDAGCDYSCVHQGFIDGKYAYSINGDWAYKRYYEALGKDLGVALIPEVNGRPMSSFYSSIALLFPNDALTSDKQNAIKQLIRYITSSENQLLFYQYVGMMPATTAAYNRVTDEAGNDPNFKTMIKQLSYSFLMPPNQAMAAAWLGMSKGVLVYMRGKASSEVAVQLMQKHAIRELKRQPDYDETKP